MNRLLRSALLSSAVWLAACGAPNIPPTPAPAKGADAPREQLAQLVEQYWDEYQQRNPLKLPQGPVIRFEPAAGYEISAQFLADSLALERRYLTAVMAIPRERLDATSQMTYDLFRRERELNAESFTYPSELMPVNPARSLPLTFARAGAGNGPYAILGAKDYDNWQRRADAYVAWSREAQANMREGLRRGYASPRALIEEMLPLLEALGTDSPENVFYEALRSIPGTLGEPFRSRIVAGITAAVKEKILPANRALHEFLRTEYLPRAAVGAGLARLPLGPAWYAYLIKRETGGTQPAAELHTQALAEVEHLRARMQAMLAEGDVHNSAPPPDQLVGDYEQLKTQVAAAMPAVFSQTPLADFSIRPVEAFRARYAPPLSYQRATPNGKSAAILYVDTAQDAARPVLAEAALYLREAVPGYHFQLAIQQERADLARFRRFGGAPAFVEGWGLYAASIGAEMGLYPDARARYAALSGELTCAALAVVDTGLNAEGWSRDKAITYLQAQLSMDEAAARTAADRTLALPAEALGCAVGERKILALRAHAEQTLGSRFDLRAFHTEVLADGAMPLDILESKVNRWLDGLH